MSDNPVLTEHIDYKWVSHGGLADVDLCEADMLVAGYYPGKYKPLDKEEKKTRGG